ncbi:MAG: hypothetical protein E4H03_00915 [Myxococcales bacterium]|jgi:hypothetical protein|nr:MAG: hypothetical protein E4H03_00915 [Myxococcales bacterium]
MQSPLMSRLSSSLPRLSRRTITAIHALILLALSLYFERFFYGEGANAVDEGWPLYAAMRLHAGGTLYSDVFFVFPPGHLLPAWIAYALDPPGLIASRVIYSAFNTALCLAMYVLGRRLMPPAYAFVAALLLCIHSPHSHISHFMFGYRYLLFPVLALLAFSRWLESEQHRWMMIAGLWTGVSLCFRLTPAVAVAVGMAAGFLAAKRDLGDWPADGLAFLGGAVAACTPVAMWLLWTVGPATVWSEIFVRPVEMTRLQSLPMPALHWPKSWGRWDITYAFEALEFRLGLMLYASYLLAAAVAWLRGPTTAVLRRPLVVAVVVWGAVYFTRALGRADYGHLDSAMPPVLLLTGFALSRLEVVLRSLWPERQARRVALTTAALVLLASILAQRVDLWFLGYAGTKVPMQIADKRTRHLGFGAGAAFDRTAMATVRLTKPGDIILDASSIPLLSALTGRMGPGGADVIMPGTFRDEYEERAFIERLERDQPVLVVVPTQDFDRLEGRGLDRYAPLLSAWIRERYAEHERHEYWAILLPRPSVAP